MNIKDKKEFNETVDTLNKKAQNLTLVGQNNSIK